MIKIRNCIVLILCLLPFSMQGQRILRVDVDSVACLGDSVFIGIGYEWSHEVVVENLITSISHPGRVFLPDGVPCGTLGCSYRSPVTFSGFDGSYITSANDINFVRLNLEHSWIGDIYIGLTCPSGQTVSLMNYSNNGSSSCTSTIPASHLGWASGSNASTSTYFGQAHDGEASGTQKCDSLASGNVPGVGWNYCWSNNTTNGYSYAPGDGLIYRSTNTQGSSIRASNPTNGTNFYHPNQSFAGLQGCPVNGTWYIEVIDGWSGDNGWIFDWELSLNPTLLPNAGEVTGIDVIGSEVTRTGDSTFLVSAPAGTTGDTLVNYIVRIFSSTGETLDTTVSIHYTATPYTLYQDRLCQGDTFWVGDTIALTETVQRIDSALTSYGCLGVTEYDIVFSPVYAQYDTAVFCGNGDPISYHGQTYYSTGDYTVPFTTVEGCDSLFHLSLVVSDSGFRAAPLISDDAENWYRDTMLAGCVPLDIWVKSESLHAAYHWWNFGDSTWYRDDSLAHTFDSMGIYTITYVVESEHGCRDTAIMKNAVWTFGVPSAAFAWSPEYPVLSHPEAEFINFSEQYTRGTFGGLYPLEHHWVFQTQSGQDSSAEANPVFSWWEDGQNVFGDFDVSLTVSQSYLGPYGLPTVCQDSSTATVTIINDWLQFPNLVTPNGDGTNDIWKVVNLLECGQYSMNELWIYNSWGALVYHVKNISREEDFWDPLETNSPDGTYYFRFSALSLFGVVRTNGAIEVIKN